MDLNSVAEDYVKIALAFKRYDGDYVDAYFGPEAWLSEAENQVIALQDLRANAQRLVNTLNASGQTTQQEIIRFRQSALTKRLLSMLLRMDMSEGKTVPFDEESRILFDAVAPSHDAEYFQAIINDIDSLAPGEGTLSQRIDIFRQQFVIPKNNLDTVFQAAIDECRRRTLEHISLPDDESFSIEYVTDQPWSAYNWYQGNHYSLIQINTDLPIFIDRAVDLGCHEAYPGHHTYNVLIERDLVNNRGWLEFTLNPLYGPQSLISEGSANFGIDMAFSDIERRQFEKQVLFPLAGLDASAADRYYDLLDALSQLDYSGNEAARGYLNGTLSEEQTIEWLVNYALSTPERAEQRVRFFETYRSYVINYNLGRDLVEDFITQRAGDDRNQQWQEFERLLSLPVTPSYLVSSLE